MATFLHGRYEQDFSAAYDRSLGQAGELVEFVVVRRALRDLIKELTMIPSESDGLV